MNKKLTKFDIAVVLGFILSLVVGVAAFFSGLQIGKDQAEAKYALLIKDLTDERNRDNVSYHQQQLVSFYHTVLQPYQEFRSTWFKHLHAIEAGGGATDGADLLKELKRLAEEISKQIQPTTIPEISPLLRDSQADYLRSLTLFADAAERLQRSPSGPGLAEAMRTDAVVQEAASFALKAQAEFYEAIWLWHLQQDPGADAGPLVDKENLTFPEWRSLPLNAKNLVISRMLAEFGAYEPFYPQDAATRIDELIASGQAEQLGVADLAGALKTVLSTGAVRLNDYYLSKDKLYKQETLPQLPFFH